MRGIGEFLGALAFLLSIPLIAAACCAIVLFGLRALALSDDLERWAFSLGALLGLVATYYAAKLLHRALEALVNRRS